MPHRKANPQRIAQQLTELALAAPQVVAHRTSRMANSGPGVSLRDQAEFMRMGNEKAVAFYQSWTGMWAASLAVQFELANALWSTAWAVATGGQANTLASAAAASNAGAKIFSAGLAPVHKKAVANAKRLSRRTRQ